MKQHPAKYSDVILDAIAPWLNGYGKVLDPFAGTGKLKRIRPDAYLVEIEPEWAEIGGAMVGNVLDMPWRDGFFDAICTSPTYGNRMADHHNAKDASKRMTYKHCLGHDLNPHNSGQLQWGKEYKDFHVMAWRSCDRVLRPGGRFILNVSNHIRNGEEQFVSQWHHLWFITHNYVMTEQLEIPTPRMRRGQNHDARVGVEYVYIFDKLELK